VLFYGITCAGPRKLPEVSKLDMEAYSRDWREIPERVRAMPERVRLYYLVYRCGICEDPRFAQPELHGLVHLVLRVAGDVGARRLRCMVLVCLIHSLGLVVLGIAWPEPKVSLVNLA
jgi:hypothetical protein